MRNTKVVHVIYIALLLLSSASMLICGALWGGMRAEKKLKEFIVNDAENILSIQLEILSQIENKDGSKIQLELEGMTAGQFSKILAYGDLQNSANDEHRCALMNRYKSYYKKNGIYHSGSWEFMTKTEDGKKSVIEFDIFFEKKLPALCPR